MRRAGSVRVDAGFRADALGRLPAHGGNHDRRSSPHTLDQLHEPRPRWQLFAYLNLFMFWMLLLVLADNFLVILICRMRLCTQNSADLPSTSDTQRAVVGQNSKLDQTTIIACSVFWRRGRAPVVPCLAADAMGGPDPVSALIHATTMVNARGVPRGPGQSSLRHAPSAIVQWSAGDQHLHREDAHPFHPRPNGEKAGPGHAGPPSWLIFAALGGGAWTAAIF